MKVKLRKFIGILTGSRWRRWKRAQAIHESHWWDGAEREIDAQLRVSTDARERMEIRKDLWSIRMRRRFYGCYWMGPRPSAP